MNEQQNPFGQPTSTTPTTTSSPQEPTYSPTTPQPSVSSSLSNVASSVTRSMQNDPDLMNAKAMLMELLLKNMVPIFLSAITFALFALLGYGYTAGLVMTIVYDVMFCRLQLIPKFGREHDELLEKIRLHNRQGGAKLSLNNSFYDHFTDKQVNILRFFMLAIMVAPLILSSLIFSAFSITSKILRILIYVLFFAGSVLTAAFYCNMNPELKHINDTYDSKKAQNSNLLGEFTEEETPFIIQE